MAAHNKAAALGAPSLNVYVKVAVIRRPEDSLSYEDHEGKIKSVSIQELGDAIATATPLVTPRPKLDIPVPRIYAVESYERDVVPLYPHNRPSYVRYHRPSLEEFKSHLDYVVDAEDEAWLEQNPRFGGAVEQQQEQDSRMPGTGVYNVADGTTSPTTSTLTRIRYRLPPQLPLDLFEQMLDILEKETAFNSIITTFQAETLFLAKLRQLYRLFPAKAGPDIVTSKRVMNDVYAYWVQKRSKLKRPLLRAYWPVTSTDDTNPHLVFRPREKEKYKLRKKRQNDLDAFRKMQQLRHDFENLRAVLELVRRREEMNRMQVQLQVDLFEQRMHEAIDTSGEVSCSAKPDMEALNDPLIEILHVPIHFDIVGGRRVKRTKQEQDMATRTRNQHQGASPTSSDTFIQGASFIEGSLNGGTPLGSGPGPDPSVLMSAKSVTSATSYPRNVAGRNHGEPAPNFLHPLQSRQRWRTSWQGSVPHIPAIVDTHTVPTFCFRHRPRIGRGGRVCIDRLPHPPHPEIHPIHVFTAGRPLPQSTTPQERLLDLLPKPLDQDALNRRLEELSWQALREECDARATGGVLYGMDPEENDGDEVMVKLDDWLDTDDQMWGEERYSIGPL